MSAMNILVLLQIVVSICAVVGYRTLPTTCDSKTTFRKIGCFHDRVFPRPRPLDHELLNIRDVYSDKYNGQILTWRNYPMSLHMLACQCAFLAKEKGYTYFGLQFWGECWSSNSLNYSRDGKGVGMDCRGPDFKKCNDKDDRECVGVKYTNYIYSTKVYEEIKMATVAPKPQWANWYPWTPCSASCDGGYRQRRRYCRNREAKYRGQKCDGEASAIEPCNEDKCEEVCKKKLDLGIIIDGSSSVGRRNYGKMKDFIIKFINMTEPDVKVGVIHYSTAPVMDFRIGEYNNRAHLFQKIKNIRYPYGITRTDKAIRQAEKRMFLCQDCTRPDVPDALIVITDGRSSRGSEFMDIATENLKDFGVTVMAIGVGRRTDSVELELMASDPDKYVFHLTGFDYFMDKFNKLLQKTCEVAKAKV